MLELLLLLTFFVGFSTGGAYAHWKIRRMVIKLVSSGKYDHIEELKDWKDELNQNKTVYKLFIKPINSTLYCYDSEDNFVCQGNTLDEIAEFAKKYKNIKYAIAIYDDNSFSFIDGKVQQNA